MAYATWQNDGKLGGVELKAAGAETSSTAQSGVVVGKGKMRVVTTITAIDTAGNDEHYTVVLEANTAAVTGTWYELGVLFSGGDSTTTGRSSDDTADELEIIIDNPYDYQVRVRSYMIGGTTSLTYSVNAYPLLDKK